MNLSLTRTMIVLLPPAPLFVRNGFMVGQKSVFLEPSAHLSLKLILTKNVDTMLWLLDDCYIFIINSTCKLFQLGHSREAIFVR